ncbi:DUF72 domain-containing protein [Sphingomonas crusticola]|uniref:DUF72 domain-containing protein n=1 Tax=Sphingomonas crusticola TaxID=1697973 RepID=UPI000E21EBE8|nr:DUF72 domain-containing protein [Sphingomonas crusticola]
MPQGTEDGDGASIRIGCSGWNYRHWRGPFYPEKLPVKRWFEFYAEQFDTVEINNSFYRLPPAETFDKWREQAPPGFAYAVKANRYLTQAKKLKDCAEPVARMMAPVRHLGATLGPILYQLPPTLQLNLARLEEFLTLLPKDLIHVFEFRHPSWYVPETSELLAAKGASFCCHDMAGSVSPRWAVGPIVYVRFHGGVGKYWGRYERALLADWADWMQEKKAHGRTVWAYFNNDIFAHAIADALELKRLTANP